MRQRFWVFPVLVGAVLLISWPFSYAGFAWVPAPLFLASMLAFAAPRPVRGLWVLAVVAELFTTLPLGVMAIAIFLPLVSKHLARRMETDFSIWFFLYIFAITMLQVISLWIIPWGVAVYRSGWQASGAYLPWPMVVITPLATAAVVFTLLIIRSFSLPSPWTR